MLQYKVVFELFQKSHLQIYARPCISIFRLESGMCGKEGGKLGELESLENEKNFLMK